MTPRSSLKFSSTAFAAVWIVGMVALSHAYDVAQIVILMLCGAGCGVGWYWAMRRVQDRWLLSRMPDGR